MGLCHSGNQTWMWVEPMIFISCPGLILHYISMFCSQIVLVNLIAFWWKSWIEETNDEFSFLYYFVQVDPRPMILRYVYRLVSRSIWAFMTIYCLLIKILRSSVSDLQNSGAAVLVCESFYVNFMSFGDKFITKTKF